MEQNSSNNQDNNQQNGSDAGVEQTDQEQGILPKAVREQKKKELEQDGKAIRRPIFNRDDDELPLQIKGDND